MPSKRTSIQKQPKSAGAAFAHTNRKGVTYYLHERLTKTGKPRLVFTRTVGEGALAELPAGYEVAENVNGIVSVRRRREGEPRIPPEHVALVQAELGRHRHVLFALAVVERDAIVVHEPVIDLDALAGFASATYLPPSKFDDLVRDAAARAPYVPVLRFVLHEQGYAAQRMTYRGDGGWSQVLAIGPLEQMASELVGKIGSAEFFDLW